MHLCGPNVFPSIFMKSLVDIYFLLPACPLELNVAILLSQSVKHGTNLIIVALTLVLVLFPSYIQILFELHFRLTFSLFCHTHQISA